MRERARMRGEREQGTGRIRETERWHNRESSCEKAHASKLVGFTKKD